MLGSSMPRKSDRPEHRRRRQREAERRPQHHLGEPDRADAEDLAEHQLERPHRRDDDLDDPRALLLEHAAHHVDAVHQHRHVDDQHQEIGEQEGLALVASLLALGAELEGLEVDPPRQLVHPLRVEPGRLQPVGHQHVVDRALEHHQHPERGHVGRHVLRLALGRQAGRQHQQAVELLALDPRLDRLPRRLGVSARLLRREADLQVARLVLQDLGHLVGEGASVAAGEVEHRHRRLGAAARGEQRRDDHQRAHQQRHEQGRDPERLGAHPLQVLPADDGEDPSPQWSDPLRPRG